MLSQLFSLLTLYTQTPADAGLHSLAWVLGGLGVAVLVLTVLDRSIPTVAEK